MAKQGLSTAVSASCAFTEADSFTRRASAGQGAAGIGKAWQGPAGYGLTTAPSIACGVWGCGKRHVVRQALVWPGTVRRGRVRHGAAWADNGRKGRSSDRPFSLGNRNDPFNKRTPPNTDSAHQGLRQRMGALAATAEIAPSIRTASRHASPSGLACRLPRRNQPPSGGFFISER